MKTMKFNKKTVRVSELYGNRFSKEELEHNQKSGIYMPQNEMMTYSSAGPKTFNEFEKELKQINPRLYMVFNKAVSTPDAPIGHPIRFMDLALPDGFDIVYAVGTSRDNLLPANSKIGYYKDEITGELRSKMSACGWSEALNIVYKFLAKRGLVTIC